PATLRGILVSGALCTSTARRQLRAFFSDTIPVAVLWTMSEFGWLGVECPQGALHLNSDHFYLELMTERRPTEVGELGELVITSIGDRVSPHIRYRTGDLFRRLNCSCGHRFPAVRAEGRASACMMRGG